MKPAWKQILVEEAIRCMALEVGIGLPPVGIVDMLGVDDRTLFAVAAVSLSVPLVVAVGLFIWRVRHPGALHRGQPSRRRRLSLLALSAVLAVAFAFAQRRTALISRREWLSAVLVNTLWVVLGLAYTLRRPPDHPTP